MNATERKKLLNKTDNSLWAAREWIKQMARYNRPLKKREPERRLGILINYLKKAKNIFRNDYFENEQVSQEKAVAYLEKIKTKSDRIIDNLIDQIECHGFEGRKYND